MPQQRKTMKCLNNGRRCARWKFHEAPQQRRTLRALAKFDEVPQQRKTLRALARFDEAPQQRKTLRELARFDEAPQQRKTTFARVDEAPQQPKDIVCSRCDKRPKQRNGLRPSKN